MSISKRERKKDEDELRKGEIGDKQKGETRKRGSDRCKKREEKRRDEEERKKCLSRFPAGLCQ